MTSPSPNRPLDELIQRTHSARLDIHYTCSEDFKERCPTKQIALTGSSGIRQALQYAKHVTHCTLEADTRGSSLQPKCKIGVRLRLLWFQFGDIKVATGRKSTNPSLRFAITVEFAAFPRPLVSDYRN